MPIGKNCKTTCARKHLLLSQPNRHVLQGGGGMFCGGPTVLPPKLVGGGIDFSKIKVRPGTTTNKKILKFAEIAKRKAQAK